MVTIHGQMEEVIAAYESWEEAIASEDLASADEETVQAAIAAIDEAESSYNDAASSLSETAELLDMSVEVMASELEDYAEELAELIDLCQDADEKKAELAGMVDELVTKLESGDCSPELREGIMDTAQSGTNKSIIQEYRDLLEYNLTAMAEAVQTANASYIAQVAAILRGVGYGRVTNNILSSPQTTLESLADFPAVEELGEIAPLEELYGVTEYTYTALGQYKIFNNPSFGETENAAFYEELNRRFSPAEGKEAEKKKAEDKVNETLEETQTALKDIYERVTLTPGGAEYYRSEDNDEGSALGKDNDWGNSKQANNDAKDAMNDSLIADLGKLAGELTDKVILVTYDTEMFSNFTTEAGDETMAGIPMSTDVNYFFQSEQEFLFNGNEESARSNLLAVSGLIMLIRFVCNYISSFMLTGVNSELTALSAVAGPFAPLVRELLRFGYAIGESALDMNELLKRPGEKVVVLKTTDSQWSFSLQGLVSNLAEEMAAGAAPQAGSDPPGALAYADYLRIFLLMKSDTELAVRTAKLIQWNVTNKKEGINADEEQMEATELFDLSQGFTDFSITTTVEMRMLFLSQPFARRGINGTIPPGRANIAVSDYRGY